MRHVRSIEDWISAALEMSITFYRGLEEKSAMTECAKDEIRTSLDICMECPEKDTSSCPRSEQEEAVSTLPLPVVPILTTRANSKVLLMSRYTRAALDVYPGLFDELQHKCHGMNFVLSKVREGVLVTARDGDSIAHMKTLVPLVWYVIESTTCNLGEAREWTYTFCIRDPTIARRTIERHREYGSEMGLGIWGDGEAEASVRHPHDASYCVVLVRINCGLIDRDGANDVVRFLSGVFGVSASVGSLVS